MKKIVITLLILTNTLSIALARSGGVGNGDLSIHAKEIVALSDVSDVAMKFIEVNIETPRQFSRHFRRFLIDTRIVAHQDYLLCAIEEIKEFVSDSKIHIGVKRVFFSELLNLTKTLVVVEDYKSYLQESLEREILGSN